MKTIFLDKIHIGDSIRKVLAEKEKSVSWLAQNIPCDRSNLYRMLRKQNLDLYTLRRVSKLLEYNFLEDCSKALLEDDECI